MFVFFCLKFFFYVVYGNACPEHNARAGYAARARARMRMHAHEAERVVWAFLTANDERDVKKVLLTIVSSENGGRTVCSNASVRETDAELFEEPKVRASAIG